MAAIAAERRQFSHILKELPYQGWDAASLCSGWRVREVIPWVSLRAETVTVLSRPFGINSSRTYRN
jgi:hypothetical protein